MNDSNWHIWATWLMIIFFLTTAWFNWTWPSGLFFLWFGIHGVLHRYTFMLTPIERSKNPWTYWAIIAMWFIFGATNIGLDVLKLTHPEYFPS